MIKDTRSATLLHGFLLLGTGAVAGVFLFLSYQGIAPLLAGEEHAALIGYVLAGVSAIQGALAVFVFKPTASGLRPGQSVGEYWAQAGSKVSLVWFLLEGAAVLSGVGFFLSGERIAAAVMVLAILALALNGPQRFVEG